MSVTTRESILRALAAGPLYRPALELIAARSEDQVRRALVGLISDGLVEVATDIGPATYRLVPQEAGSS